MKYFIILSILICFSCKEKNNNPIEKKTLTIESEVKDEKFNEFFNKFSNDSLFQKERIINKPKLYYYKDEYAEKPIFEILEKQDFNFLDFTKDLEAHKLRYNAFKTEISIKRDSIVYSKHGIDNGINESYVFKIIDKEWVLISIQNYSN